MARPRGRSKTARITVNLDEQAYAALTAIALRQDAPLAWVLRRAVMDFIARQDEDLQSALPLVRSAASGAGRS